MGFLMNEGDHISDQKFCIEVIREHILIFGEAPKKYGFNKPNAKSVVAMHTYGHRTCLGFDLMKAVRKLDLQTMQTA